MMAYVSVLNHYEDTSIDNELILYFKDAINKNGLKRTFALLNTEVQCMNLTM